MSKLVEPMLVGELLQWNVTRLFEFHNFLQVSNILVLYRNNNTTILQLFQFVRKFRSYSITSCGLVNLTSDFRLQDYMHLKSFAFSFG